MGEFQMAERSPRSSHFGSRTQTICVSLNLVICIAILGISIALISSNVLRTSDEPGKGTKQNLTLPERFPGYFRTPEQQRILAGFLNNSRTTQTSTGNRANACAVTCQRNSSIPFIPLVPGRETHHGCCYSTPMFVSPDEKVDVNGVERTLATFGDQRQYFREEDCSQDQGCSSCLCQIEETIDTGVYVTNIAGSEEYGVAFFMFDGCCKCVNV